MIISNRLFTKLYPVTRLLLIHSPNSQNGQIDPPIIKLSTKNGIVTSVLMMRRKIREDSENSGEFREKCENSENSEENPKNPKKSREFQVEIFPILIISASKGSYIVVSLEGIGDPDKRVRISRAYFLV